MLLRPSLHQQLPLPKASFADQTGKSPWQRRQRSQPIIGETQGLVQSSRVTSELFIWLNPRAPRPLFFFFFFLSVLLLFWLAIVRTQRPKGATHEPSCMMAPSIFDLFLVLPIAYTHDHIRSCYYIVYME
jgi:hypothetical protein